MKEEGNINGISFVSNSESRSVVLCIAKFVEWV